MIFYKIGCNFDPDLLEGICRLNEIDSDVQINELYGSDRRHASLTARPEFRLPDVSPEYFSDYIRKCNDMGIRFNYTMNTPYPDSKSVLAWRKRYIVDHVRYLEDAGVHIITVANPIIAEMVREGSGTIGIEVSTIAHIDTVTQIRVWKEKYSISKVCGNLLKNRSVGFLQSAVACCQRNEIVMDLMVNEFCGNGGGFGDGAYGTHCIYRDSCYLCHASNRTEEDDKLLNGYPMNSCIESRRHPASWLKMRFIRPEDIGKYVDIGINHFKITGRTASTDYILRIAEGYIRKSWYGNLLELWKPLETIHSDMNEAEYIHPVMIDNKKLDGFVDFWFNNPDHDCADRDCGVDCIYCNNFYKYAIASEGVLAAVGN